jgi:hypothetical protein
LRDYAGASRKCLALALLLLLLWAVPLRAASRREWGQRSQQRGAAACLRPLASACPPLPTGAIAAIQPLASACPPLPTGAIAAIQPLGRAAAGRLIVFTVALLTLVDGAELVVTTEVSAVAACARAAAERHCPQRWLQAAAHARSPASAGAFPTRVAVVVAGTVVFVVVEVGTFNLLGVLMLVLLPLVRVLTGTRVHFWLAACRPVTMLLLLLLLLLLGVVAVTNCSLVLLQLLPGSSRAKAGHSLRQQRAAGQSSHHVRQHGARCGVRATATATADRRWRIHARAVACAARLLGARTARRCARFDCVYLGQSLGCVQLVRRDSRPDGVLRRGVADLGAAPPTGRARARAMQRRIWWRPWGAGVTLPPGAAAPAGVRATVRAAAARWRWPVPFAGNSRLPLRSHCSERGRCRCRGGRRRRVRHKLRWRPTSQVAAVQRAAPAASSIAWRSVRLGPGRGEHPARRPLHTGAPPAATAAGTAAWGAACKHAVQSPLLPPPLCLQNRERRVVLNDNARVRLQPVKPCRRAKRPRARRCASAAVSWAGQRG